jgi:hypothetical protein
MDAALFYTPLAEFSKFATYIVLLALIAVGLWQRQRGRAGWANWIHAAIFAHFLIGALYSGARMLTTDELNDMLIRRIFAWEAWFNFACASFYFLVLTRTTPK